MRMPLRSLIRPVVYGWLGLAVMGFLAAPSRAAAPAVSEPSVPTTITSKVPMPRRLPPWQNQPDGEA